MIRVGVFGLRRDAFDPHGGRPRDVAAPEEDEPHHPRFILTLRGLGCKFNA